MKVENEMEQNQWTIQDKRLVKERERLAKYTVGFSRANLILIKAFVELDHIYWLS